MTIGSGIVPSFSASLGPERRDEHRHHAKAVAPKGQARWTLGALFTRLGEWAYDVYDTLDHPALGQPPRETFASRLQLGGHWPQRNIPYEDDSCMLTLAPRAREQPSSVQDEGANPLPLLLVGCARRSRHRGNTQVSFRSDPFDAGPSMRSSRSAGALHRSGR